MRPGTFVVVDLETTGLDYKLDRILEIGAVRLQGGIVTGEFQTLVDPGIPLREANVAIHGISADLIVGAPRLDEVLPAFLEFLGEAPVVAHNAQFDMNFLRHHATEALGRGVENPALDTLAIAREVFPHEKALSLERLLELFGEPPRPLHRALEDARALASVFYRLVDLQDQRRDYRRSQFDRIDQVAMRYRDLGRLIALMQIEAKELRRTLEVYFEEMPHDAISLPGGDVLRHLKHESHEFHPEETRAVLETLGILERVQRIDREKLDRWIKGDRLSEEQKAQVLSARRFLGYRAVMSWERSASAVPSALEV
jgi:DNA polymerase III epsilon subunit family exonuclease